MMERFAKIATKRIFHSQPWKFFPKKSTLKNLSHILLYFRKWNFLIFPEMELSSLIFLLYLRKQLPEIKKNNQFYTDSIFSCHQLCCFFNRYWVFVLLYRERYRFERNFFTLKRFLPYTLSRHFAFMKATLGAGISR